MSPPRFPFYKRVSYKYPIFKSLLEKLFQILYQTLEDSFEEIEFQNTTLKLYETNASLFAKVNVCKMYKIK
jgi:hypothetical protein